MKLIYIAGPYRGAVEANVDAAVKAGNVIKDDGRAFPVVPHLLGGGRCGRHGEMYMLAATLELMRRCDAVLALSTWQKSEGATEEVRAADRAKLPVFYDTAELFLWLSGKSVGTLDGQRGTLEELLAGLPQTLRLRCSERVREIREWRTDAEDGLLYQAHTVGKIRLSSRGDVLFEQVDDAAPEVSFDEAETQPRFAGAFPPNAVTHGIDAGQLVVMQGFENFIPTPYDIKIDHVKQGPLERSFVIPNPLFDFKEPLTSPPSPTLADLESALAQIPAARQLPDFIIQPMQAAQPQVSVKGGCRGCGSLEPLVPGAGLDQYACKKCGDTYHLPVGAVPHVPGIVVAPVVSMDEGEIAPERVIDGPDPDAPTA